MKSTITNLITKLKNGKRIKMTNWFTNIYLDEGALAIIADDIQVHLSIHVSINGAGRIRCELLQDTWGKFPTMVRTV